MKHPVREFVRNNGLSLTFVALYGVAFVGESLCGWKAYNDLRQTGGVAEVSYGEFLRTGTFWDGTFCNWQAALLQLAALIVFSEGLYQRGAAHSRKPGKKTGGQRSRGGWMYRNSLSVVFGALFAGSFGLHIVFGAKAFNEQQTLLHQRPLGVGGIPGQLAMLVSHASDMGSGIFCDGAVFDPDHLSAAGRFGGVQTHPGAGPGHGRGK